MKAQTTKRVHNPVTGRVYTIKKRSSVNPQANEVKGLWNTKNVRR
jgi:hypothetical protein